MRMTRTRWILLIIAAVIIGGFVLPFTSWLIADEGIAATSGSDFCVSCHTMDPMYKSYLQDVHGGNTAHGMQAKCVDCHLDHSSSAAYFFDKVRTGVHDIWVENMTDTSLIDWEAKREHREDFTGLLSFLMSGNRRDQTEAGFEAMNRALKARCES